VRDDRESFTHAVELWAQNGRQRATTAGPVAMPTRVCREAGALGADTARINSGSARAPLGLVGADFFVKFVFRFDCNLLISNGDELRCFLGKELNLNG
jgi:hypothetical protein